MLNNMSFLWVAAAVVWGGMLIYMITLVRRQQRLQTEIEQLERSLAAMQGAPDQDKQWAEVR